MQRARNIIFAMQPAPIQISYMKNLDVLDPSCQPKRSTYGLPEDKFIFVSSNQLHKTDLDIFSTCCNTLNEYQTDALWLLRFQLLAR
ncbi:probable UDP-N-acetylglucosamine--peptide N-acetylglucosaminyltransferase SEC [Morus notabilis]|uniref:probable UDP-N-acetylglucosamine--peptide N-acetylglucosaminyltransferase SEC n=1 Tax=Morus notabilis TaxID=981085 RepID=UPI000CED771D|nr:probable UDP-N-acetylglucosamine--peptide N-acetylglucosaminyltransferase SEC [Morus notabilis]